MWCRTTLHLFRCLLCGRHYQGKQRLCVNCNALLPWMTHYCQQCGLPLPSHTSSCQFCLTKPNAFLADACHFIFQYQEPIKSWIKLWKYDNHMLYQAFFCDCITQQCQRINIDWQDCAVMGAPISTLRQKKRGFNQTLPLAKVVASYYKIPHLTHLIACKHQQQNHAQLSAFNRHHTQSAFEWRKPFSPLSRQIIIIDDVMTTGTTLNQLAALLKQNGVKKVFYWGLARTIEKSPDIIKATRHYRAVNNENCFF